MGLMYCVVVSQAYGWGSIVTGRTISAATLPIALLGSGLPEATTQLRREDKPFPAPILRRRSLLDDRRQ
jgi:hypothetical protein